MPLKINFVWKICILKLTKSTTFKFINLKIF